MKTANGGRTIVRMSNFSPGRHLGFGKEADVLEFGPRVVKLYKTGIPKHTAFREAAALALAEWQGLPVPTTDGVRQIDGRWGVLMARIEGFSFADRIAGHPGETAAYLTKMADVHARLHACRITQFGNLKARLGAHIRLAPMLTDGMRSALLGKLASLPDGDCLPRGLSSLERPGLASPTDRH